MTNDYPVDSYRGCLQENGIVIMRKSSRTTTVIGGPKMCIMLLPREDFEVMHCLACDVLGVGTSRILPGLPTQLDMAVIASAFFLRVPARGPSINHCHSPPRNRFHAPHRGSSRRQNAEP